MSWEEIDIHLLIWLGICAIIGLLVFTILSIIYRIREHKRFMKYTEVEAKEERLEKIAKKVRENGKYYVITEKDIQDW